MFSGQDAAATVGPTPPDAPATKAADSVLPLQGAGDGHSWWVGGAAHVRGAPAGTPVHLESAGWRLTSATLDADGRAEFFSGDALVPISHVRDLTLRVEHAGLVGPATCRRALGPKFGLQGHRPAATSQSVIWSVPVSICGQAWAPAGGTPAGAAFAAALPPPCNNYILVLADGTMTLRFGR